MAYKSKFMQKMEQQGKISAASGASEYKSKFMQSGKHLTIKTSQPVISATPAPMRSEAGKLTAPTAMKPVAEKPMETIKTPTELIHEMGGGLDGKYDVSVKPSSAYMTEVSGLQVQEAELKLNQSKAKLEAVKQQETALAEQNKKLSSAQQGMQQLMAQYQMTGDEVTGNAYLLAAEEYNKLLERYRKDYAAYEKDASVYDEYNTDLLKYQKAYAGYEKYAKEYNIERAEYLQEHPEVALQDASEREIQRTLDRLESEKSGLILTGKTVDWDAVENVNRKIDAVKQLQQKKRLSTDNGLWNSNPVDFIDRTLSAIQAGQMDWMAGMAQIEQKLSNAFLKIAGSQIAGMGMSMRDAEMEAYGRKLMENSNQESADAAAARKASQDYMAEALSGTGNVDGWIVQQMQSVGSMMMDMMASGSPYAMGLPKGTDTRKIMAIRAGGSSMLQAQEEGKTETEQILMGIASGALEYASEGMFGGNPIYDVESGWVTDAVAKVIKNPKIMKLMYSEGFDILSEGLEEVFVSFVEPIAEGIITLEKPEMATAAELADAFAGGVFLSLVGQGSSVVVREVSGAGRAERQAGRVIQKSDAVQKLVSEGLAAKPNTEAFKLATDLQAKLDAGKKLSAAEIGRQLFANQDAIDAGLLVDDEMQPDSEAPEGALQDPESGYYAIQTAEADGKQMYQLVEVREDGSIRKIGQPANDLMAAKRAAQAQGLNIRHIGKEDVLRDVAQSTMDQVNAADTESTVAEKPADMKKTTPTNAVDMDYTEVNEGLQWAGNQNEGGTENVRTEQTGEPGTDGDIGRTDDLGAGERTGSGETGDVAGENGADQTARYVEDLRRSGYLSEVKSETLGFTSIESKKSIAVIRADQYNEAMQAQADKARAMGVEFELVADRIPLEQNGKKMKAAGIHKPGKILVQANNAKISMEQATDHELFHELAERDPELVNTAVQTLQDEYDQTELNEMYQKYAKTYGKAYNDGRATDEQIAQRIYEEMLADAYADYERFAGSRKYRDTVRRVAENSAGSTRTAVSSERRTYQETDLEKRFRQAANNDVYLRRLKRQYQNGEISKKKYTRLVRNYIDRTPELNEIEAEDFDKRVEQFSIAETEDDRMVAVVDSDILENIDTSTWNSEKKAEAKKAAKTALLEFRDGVVVNGVAHKINKTSRDEYTRSNETERLYRKNKTAFADKMRAAANADDIIVATTDWARDGKLTHPRTDNIVDFTKGDVLIQAGDNQYEAKTIVGITDAGEYVFYDVADMNPAAFDIKKEPSSAVLGNETENAILEGSDADPSVIGSHTENSAASVLDASGSTVSSVSNSGTNVNESFSEEPVGPQWAGNTQQQKKTTAQTGDSLTEEIRRSAGGIDSFIAAQPGRIIDRIDKIQKKVRHELHKAMGRPTDTPKDFRDTAPETVVKTYLEEGTIPQNVINELFDMAYKNTDWGTGPEAEKNKNFARSDFQAAINQCMSHMQGIRRYLKEKQDLKTMDLSNVKPYSELWKTAKRAKRNYSVVMAKSLLTYSDQIQLGRLLRGEITLEALSSTYNVEEIREAYEAKREYEDAMIALRAFKRAVKAARMEQASDHIGDVNAWKDKSINIPLTKGKKKIPELGIAYSVETMERNVRDIAPTPEIAERIISTYFTPVHVNEAKATRLKNRLRKQVADLNLSREAPKGKMSESAAVQFVGEAMDYIQQLKHKPKGEQLAGMTLEKWESELDQMWQDNPELNRAKIENAVKVFRRIYDQLFEMMNEVRIRNGYEPINYRRGYFPHFQEMETDTLLSRFSKALGADSEITALPTAIAGRTKDFKPGIRWTGFANERHGTDTVVDAVQGFDSYIEGAADVIYHTDDIQNIRALASAIRYAGSERSVQDQVDKIRRDENLSVEEKEQKIKEIYEKTPYKLSNFVQELDEYANLLANKRSKYDREMESAIGRGIYNGLKAAQSRIGANLVALNTRSWLSNLIPLTQGWPELDTRILIKAIAETMGHKQDGIVDRSVFLTNRRGSERLIVDKQRQITNTLSKPMEWIDQFTCDSLVRARYQQNLKQGLSETAAMEEADAWAASLIADRSKGAMPTLFAATNPFIKAFTQFQLEQNNQYRHWFKDVPREKRDNAIKFALMYVFKALLGTYLINSLFERLFGDNPAFEPLAILNEEIGNITGYSLKSPVGIAQALAEGEPIYNKQEREDLPTAAGNVFKTAIEQVPFIGGFVGGGRLPVGVVWPDFGNLNDAAFTEPYDPETGKGMTWQERLSTAWKEAAKPLYYLAIPFGGSQLKKMVETTEAIARHGSYSTSGNLQYPVFRDDWKTYAGGYLFGKTSLETGVEWVDSGFQGLNEKYTGAYREMIDMGEGDRASWELLQAMRDAEVPEGENRSSRLAAERRRILRESSVSGEAKYMVYHDLLASDTERERMDALEGADPETVFNLFTDMKEQDNNGDKLAILRSALTEQEKAVLFDAVKEKENARLQAATKYVDSFLYADFLEAYAAAYTGEDGTVQGYSAERVEKILRTMSGVTNNEKAAIWQITANGKEGKSNPFSTKIGKEVWDMIQKLYDQIEEDGGIDWAGRY